MVCPFLAANLKHIVASGSTEPEIFVDDAPASNRIVLQGASAQAGGAFIEKEMVASAMDSERRRLALKGAASVLQ
jgi:hypothetical protein